MQRTRSPGGSRATAWHLDPVVALIVVVVVVSVALAPRAVAAGVSQGAGHPRANVFRRAAPTPAALQITVDAVALARAGRHEGPVVIAGVPVTAQRAIDLVVERFRVTGAHTRFVRGPDARPVAFDADEVVLWRGRVSGAPASRVFLGLAPGFAAGTIDLGPGAEGWTISSRAADGTPLPAGRLRVLPDAPRGGASIPVVACGTAAGAAPVARRVARAPRPPAHAPGGPRQIELAIETDHEFYRLFDDARHAASYVVVLYGAVSDVFRRDVDVRVDLSFVRLWDEPDDLFNGPDPLPAFRDYWQNRMGHVPRDLAQFLSGRRDLPWGGIAYLRGLCNIRAYSVVAYALGFFDDLSQPDVFSRDVSTTAHELGHNCGTPHTHDLGIDACDDEHTAPQRGTIMSYCGQTFTGGEANMDLRFHVDVQEIMEAYIDEARCVAADCNGNGVDDLDDVAAGSSADANANGIPDECEDCNDNGILDDEDIDGGASLDRNGNGVPDECEPDCNENGVPDDLDIDLGHSADAFGNGIPDECEPDEDGDGHADYDQIQADMSLDLDRNARLDAGEDCDGDGTPDLVALAGANDLVVASHVHTSVHRYLARTGTLVNVSERAGIGEGQDVLVRPDGRILVSSMINHRVAEFDRFGVRQADFVPPGVGGLVGPTGMTLTPRGTLLVVSRGTRSVLEYDGETGAFLGVLIEPGAGGVRAPFGIAFGPGGDVYLTDEPGCVLQYDGTTGVFVRELVPLVANGGLWRPRGLLFLPARRSLLVASLGTDQVLEYDDATGVFRGQFNQGGTADRMTLDEPWGLRLGPDGDVYVSRSLIDETGEHGHGPFLHLTNARIYQFDADTGRLVRAYVLGVDSGIARATGFDFLPGAALDCNLNLVPDACDIARGTSPDGNANGVPDECDACPEDLDGSGEVDFEEVTAIIEAWGSTEGPGDLDGSGVVDAGDLVRVLGAWGPCA